MINEESSDDEDSDAEFESNIQITKSEALLCISKLRDFFLCSKKDRVALVDYLYKIEDEVISDTVFKQTTITRYLKF